MRLGPPRRHRLRLLAPPGRNPVIPRAAAGQATVVLVGVLAVAAALGVIGIRSAAVAVDAARARTAADAAALAGAAEGEAAAARLARENGGELVGISLTDVEATVTVRVGGAEARARARRDGTWCRTEHSATPAISYTEPPCPSTPG